MRILQITHAFPPMIGGVESHLWDLTQGLSRHGYSVTCLVGGRASRETAGSVAVIRAPCLGIDALLGRLPDRSGIDRALLEDLQATIGSIVAEAEPDIVHMHNAHHFAPEVAHAAFTAVGPRPLINSIHDRVGDHLYPDVLELSWSLTVFASSYLASALPTSGRAAVMHLGIDGSRFRPDGPTDDGVSALSRPILFHPARLLPWKGVGVSIAAFRLLLSDYPAASLVLCGSRLILDDVSLIESFRAEIEAAIRTEGLGDRVQFLEFSREMMPSVYRSVDIVWYPTIDEEPLGLVPIEAMACGRPVIVSRSGGMTETVIDGETGFLVPKGDATALADATRQVLGDPAAADSIGRRAAAHAKRFDLETYVTRIEHLYREVWLERSSV